MTEGTSAFHEFERRGWSAPDLAEGYHDGFSELTGQSIEPLLDAVGAGEGTRLQDVACGPGHAAAAAARRGSIATGLDFSAEQVALARRLHPGIEFLEGDAMALPFEDETLDAIVSGFGMPHFPDPDAHLREAFRVTRPGGRVAFVTWAGRELTAGFRVVLDAVRDHGIADPGVPAGPDFFRFADHAECERSLRAAGFEHPVVLTVPQTWRVSSSDELVDAFARGTVRTGVLLRAQTPESLRAVRAAIRDALRPFERDGGIDVPMPSVLAAARKP